MTGARWSSGYRTPRRDLVDTRPRRRMEKMGNERSTQHPGPMTTTPDTDSSVVLWRPTGPEELELVEASGWSAWPPRLPDQPIFYPVLNEDYAVRIARDWNVKASGVDHVTRFSVRRSFLERFDVQQVGGRSILEYWIPAERLDELNADLVGPITLVSTFRRDDASGRITEFREERPAPSAP
jgi:hypothetical protein